MERGQKEDREEKGRGSGGGREGGERRVREERE